MLEFTTKENLKIKINGEEFEFNINSVEVFKLQQKIMKISANNSSKKEEELGAIIIDKLSDELEHLTTIKDILVKGNFATIQKLNLNQRMELLMALVNDEGLD